jgi:membrane-associated phospholipid phosphatase
MYKVWESITWFGGLLFMLFLLFLSYVVGEREFAYRLAIGIVAATVLVVLVRAVYYKMRPDKQKYTSWMTRIDSSSFPSLHSTRIWLLAVLVQYTYGSWLALAGWVIAVAVSISRYYLKRHYASDIIVGAACGIALALGILLV